MTCKCNRLNYVEPKRTVAPLKNTPHPKKTAPKNIIKIKLADNPKDIIIKFSDKETLLKSLRELLGI